MSLFKFHRIESNGPYFHRYDLQLFDYSPDLFYKIVKDAGKKQAWELQITGRYIWAAQFHARQVMLSDL